MELRAEIGVDGEWRSFNPLAFAFFPKKRERERERREREKREREIDRQTDR